MALTVLHPQTMFEKNSTVSFAKKNTNCICCAIHRRFHVWETRSTNSSVVNEEINSIQIDSRLVSFTDSVRASEIRPSPAIPLVFNID